MTSKARPFFVAAIFFLASFTAFPQSASEFDDGEAGFWIRLPRESVVITESKFELKKCHGFGRSFEWNFPGYSLKVTATNVFEDLDVYGEPIGDAPLPRAIVSAVIADAVENAKTELKRSGATPTRASSKFAGRDVLLISNEKTAIRIFFVRKKLFMITARHENDPSAMNSALNSLRFLDERTRSELRIRDATPEPLPQSPAPSRAGNDLDELRLKGKVRRLVEASQEKPGAKRETDSITDFDERGLRTIVVNFVTGYPHVVEQWGFIDGMRVNQTGEVEYDGRDWELLGLLRALSVFDPRRKRDPRFSERFEYRYDAVGRLISRLNYLNDGTLWMRDEYSYSGRTIDTKRYHEKDQVSWHGIETLDNRGNTISSFDDYGDGNTSSTAYRLTFDSHGNWIVRRSFDITTVRGKKIGKATTIEYRTITYYP